MTYQVKLPIFEGPLDLLLHLIEENEIDIYNIPIALITQQYLDYLDRAEEIDLELTSDFVVMACTLLSIKARMLLPKPIVEVTDEESELDPRVELVQRLLEYKEYKEKAKVFRGLEARQAKHFWREIDDEQLLKKFPPPNPIGDATWTDLVTAFNEVLERVEKRAQTISLSREEITVQNKIEYILTILQKKPQGISFYQLISHVVTKEEIIVTFLALLELVKSDRIFLRQKSLFADIYIFMTPTEEGEEHAYSFS
ncbi:MAG TPA: segregation/condensation protein A [Clostridia bacterium]|jgi:segregation and condensation protein A|nr:segregation/condensation protein A [Clostridia bacterium]